MLGPPDGAANMAGIATDWGSDSYVPFEDRVRSRKGTPNYLHFENPISDADRCITAAGEHAFIETMLQLAQSEPSLPPNAVLPLGHRKCDSSFMHIDNLFFGF